MIQPLNPKAEGHHTRKRFGQNFLQDTRVIDRIVRAVSPRAGDQVIEIGPGLGALTAPLLAETRRVGEPLTVVELDRDLAAGLAGRIHAQPGELQLIEADALRLDFLGLKNPEKRLRIVGNLPYNISTPLIFRLLQHCAIIRDMHFMLQLEVVQRLAAQPGSKHWGRLGIMAQYRCRVEQLFEVPPQAFTPAPKVQSAIVRLTPWRQSPWPACDQATLRTVVKAAFAQRRKTLRNNLKAIIDSAQLEALGIDPGARAESLQLSQFIEISNATHVQNAV